MSDASGYQKLPPGWDCKYDQTTGNCYYINYFTKAMQLEDPRQGNYKQLQNERCSTESIALQPMVSNSSPYHVYPSNNLTAIRAFQERHQQPTLNNISTSPLLSASSRGHLVEMSSPLPFQRSRPGANLSRRSTIQETSFTNQIDTDAVVSKIQNMFPTAGENHIRLLLKRYMKNIFPKADEMLLLDVLANADNNVQFASEKLISLGYTKRDMQQPHKPNNRPPQLAGEDQNGTGEDKTVQHIPLRPKEYTEEEKANMQSLLMEKYPQIAERIILMALESVNYAEDRAVQILQIVQDEEEQRVASANQKMKKNLDLSSQALSGGDGLEQVDGQKASDSHQSMVTTKPLHKQRHHHHQQHHVLPSINVTTPSTFTTQIILSQSMANLDKDKQEEKPPPTASSTSTSTSLSSYASPAQSPSKCYERLTTKGILARTFGGNSSSNNNNNNNNNQSNTKNYYNSNNNYSISGYLHGSCNHSNASSYSNSKNTTTTTTTDTTNTSSSSSSMASSSTLATANENRSRLKTDSLKHRDTSLNLNNSQNTESTEFQSIIERMASLGPNSQLTKGADENLLLADYVTWNGPNTTLCQKQSTMGSDPKLLGERGYKPTGRNTELCKGAKANLAKGSIYARGGTKCN
ncbi:myb-like protein H isoform X2 [Drosophila willistoni]|uniref:myb-like protein H isoform X2 n=1 Tax=Drosophila willistoni TaxID=7260 RepID=UPI001F077A07|nr:myb-like protein H isoform X2 [Drosophila willistoni]